MADIEQFKQDIKKLQEKKERAEQLPPTSPEYVKILEEVSR